MRGLHKHATPRLSSHRTRLAGAAENNPRLRVVVDGETLPVRSLDEDRRVVIGPIKRASAITAPRLRQILQNIVDHDWSTGRPHVVEVDLSVAAIRRPDVAAVLAEAGEELRAIGGRLLAVAGRRTRI